MTTRTIHHALRGLTIAGALLLGFPLAAVAQPTETKIVGTDTNFGDRFGHACAISGDYAVVGAQAEDDGGGDAGAAYIFDLTTMTQVDKWIASDAAGHSYFGCAVGAHGDRVIVGALLSDQDTTDTGAAYIFDLADGTELLKLTASDAAEDDEFGISVAISPSYALVGADDWDYSATTYDAGCAYLFDTATGSELHQLIAADEGRQDHLGYTVAVSESYAVVGAPNWDGIGTVHRDCGAVYVFDTATGSELWRLTTTDEGAYDRFGNAAAISGDYAVIGAYWDSNAWGDDAGAAYVFDLTTGLQVHELMPADSAGSIWFGSSVAVSGNIAVIGADHYGTYDDGAAYVFDITTGEQLDLLVPSDGNDDEASFGVSVAFGGGRALIGADKDKDIAMNAGAAYVYDPIGVVTDVVEAGPLPGIFRVRNQPNPFNPSTAIGFTLPVGGEVSLEVYDLSGRLLRSLLRGEHRPAGSVRVIWDGTDDRGTAAASGAYFYRVRSGDLRATGKMILAR